MPLPAIEVTGLSKRYVIEHESQHDTLRDTLHHTARKLWRRFRWGTGFAREEFWALRDVSFTVNPGEVVGIIGRNGAGKSTLLKILSRITPPTSGSVRLRGRVASLLEVGTGFHPDLSGRENIYLNGAILGMSRAEIRKKFDEIVAFAEIEQFIDTPVKRYSSGMYVRLAFAVAAHLEPEILIVDEVLAVGDAQFQKKCLGKMESVSRTKGRTVLFVSHNMAAVNELCRRVLWLDHGRVAGSGATEEIASRYLLSGQSAEVSGERDLRAVARNHGDQQLRFTLIRTRNENGNATSTIEIGRPFWIEFEFECLRPLTGEIGFIIRSHDGVSLIRSSSEDRGKQLTFAPGTHSISCRVSPNHLRAGRYTVLIGSTCGVLRDAVEEAILFEIAQVRNPERGTIHNVASHFFFDFDWSPVSSHIDHHV